MNKAKDTEESISVPDDSPRTSRPQGRKSRRKKAEVLWSAEESCLNSLQFPFLKAQENKSVPHLTIDKPLRFQPMILGQSLPSPTLLSSLYISCTCCQRHLDDIQYSFKRSRSEDSSELRYQDWWVHDHLPFDGAFTHLSPYPEPLTKL